MRCTAAVLATCLAACGDGTTRERSAERVEPPPRITYELPDDIGVDDLVGRVERALADQKIHAEVRRRDAMVSLRSVDGAERRRAEAAVRALLTDTIEWRDCPAAAAGDVCFQLTAAQRAKLKKEPLGDAVETIRKRIDEKGHAAAPVDDKIVVELPSLEPDQLADVHATISRAGRLEFAVVDESAPFMNRLYLRVGRERDGGATDPEAKALGIAADLESWRDDAGTRHLDMYLLAYDRGADQGEQLIRRYLADLASRDPAFKLPSDRRIVFERVIPPGTAKDQRTYTRTYYVDAHPALTGSSLADARASLDAATDAPIVLLELDRAGAAAFGDLTARIIGKKLATLVDGAVRSAPVVMAAIRGGRVSIRMGGDAATAQRESEELARALRAGALPGPARERRP